MAPLRAWYFNHLHLNNYDIVISVCNAECKGVQTPATTLHIAYLQGPPTQYYWGLYDQYIANPGFGKLNWLARWGLKTLLQPMRRSDLKAAGRPDLLVANSRYVQSEIKKYYHRNSQVVYPPVGVATMVQAAQAVSARQIKQIREELFSGEEFFVVAGRQVNWKRFDLAIQSCGKAVENLLIVGDGPEHNQLVKLAGQSSRVKFLPKYDGPTEIAKYYLAAKGLIFPSLEPFGIIPIEAMACGLPVIAYRCGGSADMITPGVNGLFFDEQTVASLVRAIRKFNVAQYDRAEIVKLSQRFAADNFDKMFRKVVEQAYASLHR